MNYGAHYDRLIARARGRTQTGYRERHHVVPRCMVGSDDPENLVDLTPEEHFVAHQLLVKMHPRNEGLVHAANMMAKRCTGNKSFGWLRERNAALSAKRNSSAMIGNQRARGLNHSLESRAKISTALRGKKNSLGFRHSIETRARMSEAHRGNASHYGRTFSVEHRARLSASGRGRKLPPRTSEHAAKLAAANKGRRLSTEHRAKLSEAKRGHAPWNKGKKHSVDTRAKMSLAHRRRFQILSGVPNG